MSNYNNGFHSHSRKKKKNLVVPIIIICLFAIFIIGFIANKKFNLINSFLSSDTSIVETETIEVKETNLKNNLIPSNIETVKTILDVSKDTMVDEMETVIFGSYPQSDASGEKNDPIEWIVLDRQSNKALLLSKYILDCKCYNDDFAEITWEDCTLRNWLNLYFYNHAFNDEEQKFIDTTNVINNDNQEYHTIGGNTTDDKVFCLSIDDAKMYFGWESSENGGLTLYNNAVTSGTNYAKETNNLGNKLDVFYENNKTYEKYFGNSTYWLRSPGYFQNCAASILYIPDLDLSGIEMGNNRNDIGVRPAIWLKW